MLLLAVFGADQSGRSLSPSAARQAIMAAEDARMPLPDGLHTPAIDSLRAKLSEDVRLLIELARSSEIDTQSRAIRALGRYERRELTAEILQYLINGPRIEVAHALAQSLEGDPLLLDTAGDQVRTVLDALVVEAEKELSLPGSKRDERLIAVITRSIGRLPYVSREQVHAADAYLARAFERADPDADLRPLIEDLSAAAESLARMRGRIAPLGEATTAWLRRVVTSRRRTYSPGQRAAAMTALVASRGVDAETLRIAATASPSSAFRDPEELRRLAAISLGGAGSAVAPTERTELLIELLEDRSAAVRLEAVRAWVRQESAENGCGRVIDRMKDTSMAVALTAIDLLGDACKADVSITDRLVSEARTPPPGNWHRESHALVSLAKRAPDLATIPVLAQVTHPVWQVRMYAARAASIANNVVALERLNADPEDNVREATLAALRRLKGAESEPHFVAALARGDYQLLRTAAVEMKGLPRSPVLGGALADALKRVTVEGKETSRDTRLGLLERLQELGDENQAAALVPLLRDFDVPVAIAASNILQQWTGKPHEIAPQVPARPPIPSESELDEARDATFELKMARGDDLELKLSTEDAPITSVRFLRLVKANYYDGLTFHRVVPNFVIQGGSPGANEYAGDAIYTRDEISTLTHAAGTIGMSTRGRNTGDMQIFVNTVTNPRLDYDYTVFGRITKGDPAEILEGDRISSLSIKKKKEDR